MQPNEARELENWFPDIGVCVVRPGYEAFCDTGTAAPVKTLVRWQSGATKKMLAASGGKIFEVLSGTASQLASGYTNDRWSTEYFNGYVFAVNGVDTPWKYHGSTVDATGFSGPALTSLRTVKVVRNRLWFTASNSADVYYGGLYYITGSLNVFALSQIADGGTCMGVFAWRDNTVFCMSTGQVLVYQGDPSIGVGTDGFTLVAKYYAPALIESDAAVKMGSELILMTNSGVIGMDVVAAGLGFELDALGNWSKISPSWQADYKTYGANSGWFGKFLNGVVYFAVANGTAAPKMYIFNTRVQAWTTFAGLPAASMENIDTTVYLGSPSDGTVVHHVGGMDGASQIRATSRQAFSYLQSPSNTKVITMQRPNIFTSGVASGIFTLDTDFVDDDITGETYDLGTSGGSTPWDSPWDSPWSDSISSSPRWIGASANGRAIAPANVVYSTSNDVKWYSTDVLGLFTLNPT